jgi:hypothetical protein
MLETGSFIFYHSSVSIATELRDGTSGFHSRYELGIFLFATASRTALVPTQPPMQWVPGVKRPGREGNYSSPSSAEVKNAWSYTSTPPYTFMVWCLVKLRDNFTLPYIILSLFLSWQFSSC